MRKLAFLAFLLVSISFAAVAEVLEPFVVNVSDGEAVFLGTIGPGQTLIIVVNGAPKTGGRGGLGGRWQNLLVVEAPPGWEGFSSAQLEKEMAVRIPAAIKASPTAGDGEYKVKLRLEEDVTKQQELGLVTFEAIVKVSREVMGAAILTKSAETGVGLPARYAIAIENRGMASDTFEISSKGVPKWTFSKKVYVPPGGRLATFYELSAQEEKEFDPVITIKSLSSDEMQKSETVKLITKSDVFSDIKSTKNGILLFPIVLQPLYTLLGIVGHFV